MDNWNAEMTYEGFAIECYEAGKGLWHARLRRQDLKPVTIGGVAFPTLEIGFAWPDPNSASTDAKNQIDRLKLSRYAAAGQSSQQERSAA
jgi:hypothetical protein